MPTESQFVVDYIAAVQEEQPAQELHTWVDKRLASDFMRNAKVTLRSALLVIAITFGLLYGHVQLWILILWALTAYTLMGHRWRLVREFEQTIAAEHKPQIVHVIDFFRRHGWSWPASAFIFALPAFLYHQKVPPSTEYLCLMILVGIGTVASSLMSANLALQRAFSHTLAATTIAVVLLTWIEQWPALPSQESLTQVLLIGLFWSLIIYIGKYLHQAQRSGYIAQYGHQLLIHSLRQQTQAATEAVRVKNNLLASAAHDLRQPVHALAFYADWLRNDPQIARSVIPKILVATDSVNTLFNSLFDFARVESGAISIQMQEVNMEQLIEEMSVQFAPAAEHKGLYLHVKSRAVTVRSDPVLLRRITANLLANAVRYTTRGSVSISARLVDNTLLLEVVDTGAGIAAEHLPHVFKEFYRAPAHEGTADSFGLGLTIVQRLCKALDHEVSIESVLGQGTKVCVKIALYQHSEFRAEPVRAN